MKESCAVEHRERERNMKKALVTGVGRYLPERKITTAEMEEMAGYGKLGVRYGLCQMLTGCEARYYAAEDEYSSDLAMKAGLAAMKNAGVEPSDVDAVLFCSITQDFAEPATANVVADKLDIRNAYVFDVKNACNAFMSGVDIADSLIRTEKAETVLVVSGEALSKWIRRGFDSKEELMEKAPVTLSMGDAGGAFVIQAAENTDRGIGKSYFHTYTDMWNNNVVWGGGVMYPRDPDKMYIPGTTKEIVDKQREVFTGLFPNFEKIFESKVSDIDCFIPTQVAKWLITNGAKNYAAATGIDAEVFLSKTVSIIDQYGNMGASNIPVATSVAMERGMIKENTKALCMSVGVGISEAMMTITF